MESVLGRTPSKIRGPLRVMGKNGPNGNFTGDLQRGSAGVGCFTLMGPGLGADDRRPVFEKWLKVARDIVAECLWKGLGGSSIVIGPESLRSE